MKSYSQKLSDYLDAGGWEVENIFNESLELWADEIWELKYTWAPNGATAFITFLVDPQHEGNGRQGISVWGVGASKRFPLSREAAQGIKAIALSGAFTKDIEQFLDDMESLRTNE